MIAFADTAPLVHTILLGLLFLSLVAQLFVIMRSIMRLRAIAKQRRKVEQLTQGVARSSRKGLHKSLRRAPKMREKADFQSNVQVGVDIAVFLVTFVMLVFLQNITFAKFHGFESFVGATIPVWVVCVVALAAIGYAIVRVVKTVRDKPNDVGPNSIKQAIDTLPVGVCYFSMSGSVVLANLQMYKLYQHLSHHALQSYVEFKRSLALVGAANSSSNHCDSNVVYLLDSENDYYSFPDKSVWQYRQKTVRGDDGGEFIEAIFTNVTELHARRCELEQQMYELQAFSEELRQLSAAGLALTKEAEIVSAKARLHDRMGAALTALRHSLDEKSPEAQVQAAHGMKQAVQDIQGKKTAQHHSDEIADFISDAAFVGVEVVLSGKLPEDDDAHSLCLAAMRECLTNAVRHARATRLDVTIATNGEESADTAFCLKISNNGKPPRHPVTPTGGLKNISRLVTRLSGNMAIMWEPHFALTLVVPTKPKVPMQNLEKEM